VSHVEGVAGKVEKRREAAGEVLKIGEVGEGEGKDGGDGETAKEGEGEGLEEGGLGVVQSADLKLLKTGKEREQGRNNDGEVDFIGFNPTLGELILFFSCAVKAQSMVDGEKVGVRRGESETEGNDLFRQFGLLGKGVHKLTLLRAEESATGIAVERLELHSDLAVEGTLGMRAESGRDEAARCEVFLAEVTGLEHLVNELGREVGLGWSSVSARLNCAKEKEKRKKRANERESVSGAENVFGCSFDLLALVDER
jgi:hypothetical protein